MKTLYFVFYVLYMGNNNNISGGIPCEIGFLKQLFTLQKIIH
jgi:hypothetical protein